MPTFLGRFFFPTALALGLGALSWRLWILEEGGLALVPLGLLFVSAAELARRREPAADLATAEDRRGRDQLRALHHRLERAEQERGRFFTYLSHELRTPLSLILASTESLDIEPGVGPAALTPIRKNALLLHKHLEDLLTLARREKGQLPIRYRQVDLRALVEECAAPFAELAMSRGIELEVVGPEVLWAEVDPGQIERVVLNLLFNAHRFTPPRGRIRCSLELDDAQGSALLHVADDGPGVDPAHRAELFHLYGGEGRAVARTFGGSGLGLALSRELVEAHGGSIAVDDGLNPTAAAPGCCFTVRLPRRAPEGIQVRSEGDPASERSGELGPRVARLAELELVRLTEGERESSGPQVARRAGRAQPVILVAEDDKELRVFLRSALADGYDVLTVSDGHAALELMEDVVPDLVLTDLVMPRLDGRALIARMRADRRLSAVPVIALSALGGEDISLDLFENGAQDYLTKPFRLAELRARVAVHVQQKQARDALGAMVRDHEGSLATLAAEVADKSRDLERSLAEAQRARDLAERTARLRMKLLGLMSHELRSPMASLQLQLSLLVANSERPDLEGTGLVRALRCCDRLGSILDTVLALARAQSGELILRVEPVSLRALAADVARELEVPARARGLRLIVEEGEDGPPLPTNPDVVRMVLANLVGNAVKYTDEGEVRIRVAQSAQGARIEVRDTGPGISPEEQRSIFDPFVRLEGARRSSADGSGLGLAIVKDLSEALGGRVRLAASDEQGSTFEVTLPAAPPLRDADRKTSLEEGGEGGV